MIENDVAITREEAAQYLGVGVAEIDAMVAQKHLRTLGDAVSLNTVIGLAETDARFAHLFQLDRGTLAALDAQDPGRGPTGPRGPGGPGGGGSRPPVIVERRPAPRTRFRV